MAMYADDDALMEEFDRPMTPPNAVHPPTATRYPSLHDLPTDNPASSHPSFRQTTAPALASSAPGRSQYPSIPTPASLPKYPSLNASSTSFTTPTYPTAAGAVVVSDPVASPATLPELSLDEISFSPPSYSLPTTSTPVFTPASLECDAVADEESSDHPSSMSTSPSGAHHPASPVSPSSSTPSSTVAKALKDVEVLEADAEVDVQQELHTMQTVMHHIDLALRGETPHQIAQRELREAARQERERQRLERQLAQHEQHVQRLAARLAKQSSSIAP